MISRKKYTFIVLALLSITPIFFCCEEVDVDNVETIDFFQYTEEDYGSIPRDAFDSREVELKTDDPHVLGSISKVILSNERIYVLDDSNLNLFSFTMEGNFISQVGCIGRGPGEYINICDFAVDSLGKVWILDPSADRIIIYDSSFNFLEVVVPQFDVDALEMLNDSRLLFMLAPWNMKSFIGSQLITTDANLKRGKEILPYSRFVDSNFELSQARFIKTGSGFFYHKPIDDNVYYLNQDGEIEQIFHFDFGNRSVPDEDKLNVGDKWDKGIYAKYSTLMKFVVVEDNYICGSMLDNGKGVDFIVNRKDKKIYKKPCWEETQYGVFVCFSNDYLISSLPPEEEDGNYKIILTKINF